MNEYNDKAIPEWMIVKREILNSYYTAASAVAKVRQDQRRGQRSWRREAQLDEAITDLYMKLRPKIGYYKQKEYYLDIVRLGYYVDNGVLLKMKALLKYFFCLQRMVEDMGITKIEKKTQDPELAVLEE